MNLFFDIWHSIQHTLFPWLENELDPPIEKRQEFILVIELAEIQKHMSPYRWQGIGRKRDDRLFILEAFVAKSVYNFPTTKMLIAYLHDSTNLRRLAGVRARERSRRNPRFLGRLRNFCVVVWGRRFTRRWLSSMPGQSLRAMSAVMKQRSMLARIHFAKNQTAGFAAWKWLGREHG